MSSKSLKILVMGDRGVGKTSLIQRYVKDNFDEKPAPPTGMELEEIEDIPASDFVQKRVIVDDQEVSVTFWDQAATGTPPTHSYYAGAHGCCLVFSTIDAQSLQQLQAWYEAVQTFCNDEKCPMPAIVIAENKVDLIDESVVDAEAVEKAAKQYRLRLYRTSAKEGHQVTELFDYITGKAVKYDAARKDAGANVDGANGSDQRGRAARTPSAASWTLPTDDSQKHASEPSKRRTGGVKPLFNKNKCPVM